MPPECYKVEVLHLLNPHLIWVEVCDAAITALEESGIKYEQIGIYGLVPLESAIDLDNEDLSIEQCKEWLPEAAAVMRKFVAEDEDLFFIPLYLYRRSSMFGDQYQKFGDLHIKKKNGKTKSLAQLLRTSGFATYEAGLFHRYLGADKMDIKLGRSETCEVFEDIEKYYLNKKAAKSEPRVSEELEETFMKTNPDKCNKGTKATLELCKGVDEPSLGRATTRKGKETTTSTPIEKRLELLRFFKMKMNSRNSDSQENDSIDDAQDFEDTKMHTESMTAPFCKKILSKTDAHKAQILKKVMSKTAVKRGSKQEKLVNRLLTESKNTTKSPEKIDVDSSDLKNNSNLSTSHTSILEGNDILQTEETKQSILTDAASTTKDDQNVLGNNIDHNSTRNQETSIEGKSKSETIQEMTATASASFSIEDNKNALKDSNNDEQNRSSLKGKGLKKVAKVEEHISTLECTEQLNVNKQGNQTTSSPQQKLGNAQKKENSDQDSLSTRRVPNLPKDREVVSSKSYNEKVKDLMSTFKAHGSKHGDVFHNGKYKHGTKDNDALKECRTKYKRRGKRHTVVRGRTKAVFGPPGIDVNSLSRVPSVFVYGQESDDGQNKAVSDRIDSKVDANSSLSSDLGKNNVPSCSSDTKVAIKNTNMQESETRTNRNNNKGTSSSGSSVWERRLKLHKKMAKNKRCASQTSNTTNKDSSYVDENSPPKNFIKQKTDQDSDESISEVIGKLDIAKGKNNTVTPAAKENDQLLHHMFQQVGIKANPYQNFDIHNSVFVDNLLTPIMMVHSKMNKRFVPKNIFRDIQFTDHIRLVLKNLRIDRPMMIQSISWNEILRGHSVIMIGSAYSGKTMGYLPAVCRLLTDFNQSDSYCDSVGPCCIIVCATSQSVFEIENIAKMLVNCNEKVVSCHYGHDEQAIATSLLNGCDLLICTPSSLVRLLQMSEFGVDLQRLATFVMDDCERLVEVYLTELKYCLNRIEEMLKSRVNKELLVQYIVASRIWCDFMEPFAKKAPNSVVCIGAFQECVLYSKTNMTVSYVKKENKLNHLIEFLEDIDPAKRTIVVCDTDDEVDFLNRAIQNSKYFVFASNSKMTVQDLYNLSMLWKEFREPLMAPVLICCDSNLFYMNIINANYLVQYSMPSLYSTFCRRFATLNESYPSIFKPDNQHVKILILLEENNVEQFPKIVNFVKRCTNKIPDFLYNMCETVLTEKDAKKAESFIPLCNTLLSLGHCPDLYNCKSRHTMIKRYDEPKEWMPKSGTITYKILHHHSATSFSVRLIAHFDGETYTKYPTAYSSISLKIGTHYSIKKNRILFGIPNVGDICAVALRNDLFARCQVIKIIDRYERGNPKNILVSLIDEEKLELTLDTNLYYLPEELTKPDTFVVHVRLANIQPRDKDIVFSELAKNLVKFQTDDLNKGLYMRGKIILTVANIIYVDTLETCKDLKSLKGTVVVYDVKYALLDKHAEVNPDHITKIKLLCERADIEVIPKNKKTNETPASVKVKPNIIWAHLEENMSMVDFGVIENPDMLFLRNTKFEECLKSLIADIQTYISKNSDKIETLVKDDIVLAEYPDDGIYERARVDEIEDEKIKCFFVDQGEWRHLSKDKLKPILDTFITRLPFQAIECRLVGVQPPGNLWTDFSSNWLFDKCAETENGIIKQLYAKYFTKEPAQFTGGLKYGVVLIDTYGENDLILNREMIDLNLAKEIYDELKFFDVVKREIDENVQSHDEEHNSNSSVKQSTHSPNNEEIKKSAPNILLSQPIRSVPLIGTDDDSDESDKWNLNMTGDMAEMFRPMIESTNGNIPKLPAIENVNEVTQNIDSGVNAITEEIDVNSVSKNMKEYAPQFQCVKINVDSSKDLDSDDFSSPETCQSGTESLEKAVEVISINEKQLRKPTLHWSQTKSSVIIKIILIGAEKYDLKIQDRGLIFEATLNDSNYSFDIDLYGVINKKNATHSNKGQYILVKLNKILHKNWLTLTRDGGIRKWILYDVDSIDISSDEEERNNRIRKDNLYNIMKTLCTKMDSDSDEDLVDDVTYRHK